MATRRTTHGYDVKYIEYRREFLRKWEMGERRKRQGEEGVVDMVAGL